MITFLSAGGSVLVVRSVMGFRFRSRHPYPVRSRHPYPWLGVVRVIVSLDPRLESQHRREVF